MKKLVFMICVLLCGCGNITDKGIREAYKQCETRGGVKCIGPVYIDISDSAKVKCNNGTVITFDSNYIRISGAR